MTVLVGYCVLVATPVFFIWLMVKAIGWTANWSVPRRKTPPPPSSPSNLERLVDDLRRLEREYLRVERSDLPARAARLRALNLAYDDTLRACCHELGLPEPHERPLSGVVRLQTEAELAQHGLVW